MDLLPPEARALLGAFLFACNQILVRRLMDRASALTVTVWVNMWMGVFALAMSPIGDSFEGSAPLALAFFLGVGLVGNGLARYMAYRSTQLIGVSRTNTVVAASPIGAAVTGVILLGERPGAAVWAGVGLVVAGLILLTSERGGGRTPPRLYFHAFVGTVAFSLTPYLRKAGLMTMDAPWIGIWVAIVVANVSLLATSRLMPAGQGFRWDPSVALACGPAGALAIASAINFWTSLRDGPLAVISPLIRMTPVFALLLSYLLLREREAITGRLVAATLIVVAGAVLVTAGG